MVGQIWLEWDEKDGGLLGQKEMSIYACRTTFTFILCSVTQQPHTFFFSPYSPSDLLSLSNLATSFLSLVLGATFCAALDFWPISYVPKLQFGSILSSLPIQMFTQPPLCCFPKRPTQVVASPLCCVINLSSTVSSPPPNWFSNFHLQWMCF